MRKKILGGLLVVAIAAVAAFNMSFNTQEKELSLLALANVEALAGESSATECPSSLTKDKINYCYEYKSDKTSKCQKTGNIKDFCHHK